MISSCYTHSLIGFQLRDPEFIRTRIPTLPNLQERLSTFDILLFKNFMFFVFLYSEIAFQYAI